MDAADKPHSSGGADDAHPVRSDLRAAAEAVVARWDTPLWKDAEPTADVVARLRMAIAADKSAPAVGAEPALAKTLADDARFRAEAARALRGHMKEIGNLPEFLDEVADALDSARQPPEAEIARLTACLKKANSQAEHFEREWYLLGHEVDRLNAARAAAPDWMPFALTDAQMSLIKRFLDAAAAEGFVLNGIDAADLYTSIWPGGPDAAKAKTS